MRWLILCIPLLAFACAGGAFERIEDAAVKTSVQGELSSPWRRTAQGWEQNYLWPSSSELRPRRNRTIHPLAVAMLQLLLSLACLIALSGARQKKP